MIALYIYLACNLYLFVRSYPTFIKEHLYTTVAVVPFFVYTMLFGVPVWAYYRIKEFYK